MNAENYRTKTRSASEGVGRQRKQHPYRPEPDPGQVLGQIHADCWSTLTPSLALRVSLPTPNPKVCNFKKRQRGSPIPTVLKCSLAHTSGYIRF